MILGEVLIMYLKGLLANCRFLQPVFLDCTVAVILNLLMEEKGRVWLVVHVICNCELPLVFSRRATRQHCNFCFLFPSHPLPSSFTFAPLFTFGYPRSPIPLSSVSMFSDLPKGPAWIGRGLQKCTRNAKSGCAARERGAKGEWECASATFASGGSFSLDYCRCYYSFHLLLRLLFLSGQSSIQFSHYGWKPSHSSPGVLREKNVPIGLINVWTHRSIYTSEN